MAEDGKVCVIKQLAFPHFRFEWHPLSKRVYLIRLGVEPAIGEAIAFEIFDQGAGVNAVLIWLRGYRAGSAPAIGSAPQRKEATG